MGDFAIIGEGITDQTVIKNVLLGYFADADEEPFVVFEQPQLDCTGQQTTPSHGGWGLVIKYFEEKRFIQALQFNRYLIVHIDTDVAPSYGIPHQEDGQTLAPEILIDRVVSKFAVLIGEEIWHAHRDRFVFAIAVHGIECWLLPLYFRNDYKPGLLDKIAGCLGAINGELNRKNESPLSTGEGDRERKFPEHYGTVSKPFRKRKVLDRCGAGSVSLAAFLKELGRCAIPHETTEPPSPYT